MDRGRMTINEMLAAQVAVHETMWDKAAPATALRWTGDACNGPLLFHCVHGGDAATVTLTDHALTQTCQRFDMPVKYIRTLPSDLSAPLFNYENGERIAADYLLRFGPRDEGYLRALLSSRYVPLDNAPVLGALAEMEAAGSQRMKVFESYTSSDEFYFKWLLGQRVNLDGEGFHIGVVIGNSEIGTRSASCEPFLYRDACENGLIYGYRSWSEAVFRRRHIHTSTEELYVGMAKALERALGLLPAIEKMIKSAKAQAVNSLDAYIEGLVSDYGFAQREGKEVRDRVALENPSGKYTVWGVVNGITATAKAAEVERQLEMERVGGEILADLLGGEGVINEAATIFSRN